MYIMARSEVVIIEILVVKVDVLRVVCSIVPL